MSATRHLKLFCTTGPLFVGFLFVTEIGGQKYRVRWKLWWGDITDFISVSQKKYKKYLIFLGDLPLVCITGSVCSIITMFLKHLLTQSPISSLSPHLSLRPHRCTNQECQTSRPFSSQCAAQFPSCSRCYPALLLMHLKATPRCLFVLCWTCPQLSVL